MPAPKKYPDELRERAVRLVLEIRKSSGQKQGVIARVADQLGVNRETLRNWVNQAEVDDGQRPGTSTEDGQRIAELEREVPGTSARERRPESGNNFLGLLLILWVVLVV